jgi:two-component system, OmpR family, alkaline phosphatase synthesis response regulator PhoP
MGKRILVVEDSADLALVLGDRLRSEGYEVQHVNSGESALLASNTGSYDLMLLDVMLPGISGFDVCLELRRRCHDMPILMLTARGETVDKIVGLRLGADDYLTKPFDFGELLARLEALVRRISGAPKSRDRYFRFDDVIVDSLGAEVHRNGARVDLTAREFLLLRYLIENRGAVQSREHLMKAVWNYGADLSTRTLDVHIAWLRQKLEKEPSRPRHIVTVRGLGYKFVD